MQTAAVIVVPKRVVSLGPNFGYYNMLSTCAVKREFKIKLLLYCLNNGGTNIFTIVMALNSFVTNCGKLQVRHKKIWDRNYQTCLSYMPLVWRNSVCFNYNSNKNKYILKDGPIDYVRYVTIPDSGLGILFRSELQTVCNRWCVVMYSPEPILKNDCKKRFYTNNNIYFKIVWFKRIIKQSITIGLCRIVLRLKTN